MSKFAQENEGEAQAVVQIDEHNLDRECVRLPTQYLRFAHRAAEAQRDYDEAKAELDVVEADLSKRIRETPAKFGYTEDKITEKGIAAFVLLQPEYRAATKDVAKAKYDMTMMDAVVRALDIKKRTVGHLVDLHGMGYFARVKTSAEGKEAVDRMMRKRVSPRRGEED